jgi:ribosomal protein L7/L12
MNHWPELQPDAIARIEIALGRGQKIEAIRIYRDATGVGLKEAKDAIERADPIHPHDVPRSSGTN